MKPKDIVTFICAAFFVFSLFTYAMSEDALTRGISVVAKDPATGQTGEVGLYNKSYAVVIGIDQYKNLPPDRQLSYAVHDAQGVEDVLRKNYRFDAIYTLYDNDATKEGIMKLLTADLPKTMGPEDSLFVFWAGHGNEETTRYGELGYLIPYDGSTDGIYTNITMTEIRDTISKTIPAKHVFYVMDACYSGLLTTRSVDPKISRDLSYLREITKEPARQVLTAGTKDQEVLDGGPSGHSVFTGRLLEVLEAKRDFITANEIQAILKEKVYGDAKGRGHVQTPSFGVLSGSGDFVFVPNIGRKSEEVASEIAKLQAEMERLEKREAEALKARDEAARRQAVQEKLAAEAKLKAEKLKQEEIRAEARKREEQLLEQSRREAKFKEQEAEQIARRKEEEKRLAELKKEIARKRNSEQAASSATIEAAVAEIRRISARIDEIEAAFSTEENESRKRIEDRYEALFRELDAKEAVYKPNLLKRDMFETEEEFAQRKQRESNKFADRRRELQQQKKKELDELKHKFEQETADQTAPFRQDLLAVSQTQYVLDSTDLELKVGKYDIDRGEFPVTLGYAPGAAKPVELAFNGTIQLRRDNAKEWWGDWQNGLVAPQATVQADGKIADVKLKNYKSPDLELELEGTMFISLREKQEWEKLAKDLAGEFVWVEGGCFDMGANDGYGNEQPVHEVCVDGFNMAKFEVTQAQWEKVMGSNPSEFKGSDRPVEQVSWNDAQEYIRKLSRKTGKPFRLPTEAEWEYAAKGGQAARGYEYAGSNNLGEVAWYDSNSGLQIHPVGQKAPNELGLYDMSGNVWEWVQDRYGSGYYSNSPRDNPQGPSSGSDRVNRGGSWFNPPSKVRSANRNFNVTDDRNNHLGFRLVLSSE